MIYWNAILQFRIGTNKKVNIPIWVSLCPWPIENDIHNANEIAKTRAVAVKGDIGHVINGTYRYDMSLGFNALNSLFCNLFNKHFFFRTKNVLLICQILRLNQIFCHDLVILFFHLFCRRMQDGFWPTWPTGNMKRLVTSPMIWQRFKMSWNPSSKRKKRGRKSRNDWYLGLLQTENLDWNS